MKKQKKNLSKIKNWKKKFQNWERAERRRYQKIRKSEITGLLDIDGEVINFPKEKKSGKKIRGGETNDFILPQFSRGEKTPDQGEGHNEPLIVKLWSTRNCSGGWGSPRPNLMGYPGVSGGKSGEEGAVGTSTDGACLVAKDLRLKKKTILPYLPKEKKAA